MRRGAASARCCRASRSHACCCPYAALAACAHGCAGGCGCGLQDKAALVASLAQLREENTRNQGDVRRIKQREKLMQEVS